MNSSEIKNKTMNDIVKGALRRDIQRKFGPFQKCPECFGCFKSCKLCFGKGKVTKIDIEIFNNPVSKYLRSK